MSERKDQKTEQTYSVDEILAEYSSKSKVVEFPGGISPDEDERPVRPAPTPRPARQVETILPETRAHGLAARIATWRRRADNYADHMYEQAEPDEATLKAEKYIPGVDTEEIPDEDERPVRRSIRRPVKLPPDTPAAELAGRYQKGLTGRKVRIGFAFILSILCIVLSVDLSGGLPFTLPAESPVQLPTNLFPLQSMALAGLLFIVGALCFDILWLGLKDIFSLRPLAVFQPLSQSVQPVMGVQPL